MKVAIYARKSQENEDAVTRQITLAREFAERAGHFVAEEFTDDGISGAEFVDRPGLSALMSAVKAHSVEGVVTMNVDRFGREAYRTNLVMLEIVEAGCRIFTYQDGQEVKLDTPIAKQMISMRNYAAEDFNANISAKTQAALLLKARAGHATGTKTYGYDLVRIGEGKSSHVERRINPVEAEVVRKVFTMAAKGLGNGRIVNALNEEHTTVRTVLGNRLYIGEIVFGRSRPAVSGGRAKKRAVIKDESKWTVVSLPDLRIVSAALWTQVQARRAASLERFAPHRAENGKLNGRPEAGLIAGHLLNGFLICGTCGGSMGFTSKNGHTKSYYCMRRRSYGKAACSNARGVPEDRLDSAVLGSLHKLVKDPETMWALVQERTERWRREQALTVDTRRNLEREEKKLVKKIENLTAAIEDGQPVGNALKQRQAELDALRARLAADGVVGQTDEDAFERMLLERAEQLGKYHGPVLGGYAKSHPQTRDNAQTRAAMRSLGVDRITVTPSESGWTFVGDGNLSGLVQGDGERVSRRSPRFPPPGTFSVESPPGPRFVTLV